MTFQFSNKKLFLPKMWNCIKILFLEVVLASLFSANKAEKILKNKIKGLTVSDKKRSDLDLKTLKEYSNKYDDYRRDIEGKAKLNMLGITLSFSIVFAGLSFIVGQSAVLFRSTFSLYLFPLFVVGIIYFIISGLTSMKVYRIGEWNDIQIDDELLSEGERAALLKNCLDKNENILINKRNYTYVSQVSLRNGIVLISIFIIALIIFMILSIK